MVTEVSGRAGPAVAGLEAVLEQQWLPLIRLATVLADADAARDIVQDCYEAVWRLQPEVTDAEHFVAYLRKAVVNRSRSRLRRLRTLRRFVAQAQPPADAPPADHALLVAEQHRELIDRIDRLPTRQREVLVLRYYSGLSEAETAAVVGISIGTVKSASHRAIASLRRDMKDHSDDQ
jgi:RNA polymerase sigma-70 factor (sigma-E family)